jgi:hypothetical protein
MAWWDQADLAASWQHAPGEMGQIVDIRAVKNLDAGVAETLKYVMKPTNLLEWGPSQVAQFNALGRTKLRECYGAMRGLVGEIDGDGEDELGIEPEELPLVEGKPGPTSPSPQMAAGRIEAWIPVRANHALCERPGSATGRRWFEMGL